MVGNVLGSLGSVKLEVVGVGLDSVGSKTGRADEIVNAAVILESRGVGSETSETSGIAGLGSLASASAQSIVRLVGSVPGVAEQGDGSDVTADTRLRPEHTGVALGWADGIAAVTSENVADDGGALAVATQDNGGVGALGVVCINLLQREELTSRDGWAVVGGVGVVCNVLVVTAHAREVGTDGGGEVALTAGV